MYLEKTISIWVLRTVIAVIVEMKEFKDELEPIKRHHIVEKGGFQQRICTQYWLTSGFLIISVRR